MDTEEKNVILITGNRDNGEHVGIMATLEELENAISSIKKSIEGNIITL
jgi:hypothetical protein